MPEKAKIPPESQGADELSGTFSCAQQKQEQICQGAERVRTKLQQDSVEVDALFKEPDE